VPSILYTKSDPIPNYQLYLCLPCHYYHLPPPLLTHPSPANIVASWYCLRLVCFFFFVIISPSTLKTDSDAADVAGIAR
jgi:hypothetical protein